MQIFHRGWDQHGNVAGDLPLQCKDIDQASYGLITDLKQTRHVERHPRDLGRRVWPNDLFAGRPVEAELRPRSSSALLLVLDGRRRRPRRHHHGETDDFSYNIIEKPVHIHDLNATTLHCLGIDHKRLTYKFQGLDTAPHRRVRNMRGYRTST